MKDWIQKHSLVLSLLLVIAVMVMIYCFSAQTGEESGAMSGRITRWVLSLVVPGFEDMPASEQEDLREIAGLVVRKLAHFSEYALLGLTLLLHIAQIQKKRRCDCHFYGHGAWVRCMLHRMNSTKASWRTVVRPWWM